ncbi:MAG: lipopolysaccharide kinase InaA family protein [Dysgonamonadaceae bacterium]|jgi:hypothetical protein|nr:lipopolysaccharide kinase InaA family protein [Dysgonamonadaceae bacterium]
MDIIIHPEYASLDHFIRKIPACFAQTGTSIYKGRNELRVFDAGGEKLAVKSFKIPHIINRVAYSFFRKSKAKRSYENALEIIRRGFNTPQPVACIEEFKHGLLHRSYYVCKFCDYERSFREFTYYKVSFEGKEDILTAFAGFTARLQNAGIYHKDYSPGNILFTKNAGGIDFCLVDINRVKFGYVGEKAGYKNFERIWGGDEMFAVIAERYASDRGFDVGKSVATLLHYNHKVMVPPKKK